MIRLPEGNFLESLSQVDQKPPNPRRLSRPRTPEEEFDFSQYEEHLFLTVERDYAFFQVKIPIRVKDEMKRAVSRYAKKHNITEKNEAMLAGKVFASLLGMPSWTKP